MYEYHHLIVFVLSAGRLRRSAAVQWSSGRSHLLGTELWSDQEAWSLQLPLRETAGMDQKHDKEI